MKVNLMENVLSGPNSLGARKSKLMSGKWNIFNNNSNGRTDADIFCIRTRRRGS